MSFVFGYPDDITAGFEDSRVPGEEIPLVDWSIIPPHAPRYCVTDLVWQSVNNFATGVASKQTRYPSIGTGINVRSGRAISRVEAFSCSGGADHFDRIHLDVHHGIYPGSPRGRINVFRNF